MAFLKLPDIEYLRECFDCDPVAGTLTWRQRPLHHFPDDVAMRKTNSRFAGRPAGTKTKRGYVQVNALGNLFRRSRIIWKMTTGNDPIIEIDHKNRIPSNDWMDNLRLATRQQNARNWGPKKPRDLPVGVSWIKDKRKFRASIKVSGRMIFLGYFSLPEEATKARRNAAEKLHGEFATHE